eukprot:6177458-Pleurochrysis_carterae.AAC.1
MLCTLVWQARAAADAGAAADGPDHRHRVGAASAGGGSRDREKGAGETQAGGQEVREKGGRGRLLAFVLSQSHSFRDSVTIISRRAHRRLRATDTQCSRQPWRMRLRVPRPNLLAAAREPQFKNKMSARASPEAAARASLAGAVHALSADERARRHQHLPGRSKGARARERDGA